MFGYDRPYLGPDVLSVRYCFVISFGFMFGLIGVGGGNRSDVVIVAIDVVDTVLTEACWAAIISWPVSSL